MAKFFPPIFQNRTPTFTSPITAAIQVTFTMPSLNNITDLATGHVGIYLRTTSNNTTVANPTNWPDGVIYKTVAGADL
jgi:hypothetical protein